MSIDVEPRHLSARAFDADQARMTRRAYASSMTSPLPQWRLGSRKLIPIVQGGMGVGVSAHRLAGSVARAGAMGTISSVELRQHHPDLLARDNRSRDKALIDKTNLVALDREVRAALALSAGR